MAKTNPNAAALKKYANGWEKGDSSIIYSVLDKKYTYTIRDKQMNQLVKPVKRKGFKQFMVKLRKMAADNGGPAVKSVDFMRRTNVKKRKVTKMVQVVVL